MKLKEIKKENISYKTNIYSKCLEEDTWNKLSRWNVNIGILKTHVQPIGMLQKKKRSVYLMFFPLNCVFSSFLWL